ncbi:hypothetical protein QUF72_11030 [Desulfobacterales bacterium HSG2]|nr:hypothetical protein [Desulfobacterales bacterium HSG2]
MIKKEDLPTGVVASIIAAIIWVLIMELFDLIWPDTIEEKALLRILFNFLYAVIVFGTVYVFLAKKKTQDQSDRFKNEAGYIIH